MKRIVKAEYIEPKNPQFKGNLLIEALPRKLEHDDFFRKILSQKAISRKEAIEHDSQTRIEFMSTFRLTFFVPQERLYQLYNSIYYSLIAGYHLRNPLNTNVNQELRQSYHDMPYMFINNENASSLSSCLLGISGIGKTTAVNKILSLIPQAISHEKEGMEPFVQVPFIKIECPRNSSLKDLCRNFFYQLDQVLQTNYQSVYDRPRSTMDSMVNAMVKLAKSHRIGLLIIDEIQQLTNVKANNAELLLNFFVNLNNTFIPILIVGTPESLGLFSRSHRLPRRWSGEGAKKWRRLPNDYEWEFLVEMLFNHQYTTESIGYSKRWADLFYFHSQGIIDIAVRIFTESQKCALENKLDSIDEDLVHEVVKESFWLEIPAIQALRSGKLKDITQYPDLFFNDDLQENASLKDSHKIKQESCFQTLLECDIPHGYYSDLVVDMVKKYPQYSAEKIVLEIIQQYQKEETTIEKEKSQNTITLDKNYVEGDLRKCNPESEDLHEQLKAKGILLDLRNEGILPLYGS